MMPKLIYGLCMLTSFACMFLLLRGFLRTRVRLLLWSGLCFAGLTLNNILLLVDREIFPGYDLSTWRLIAALAALLPLLYGMVLEGE
jgi:membrane-anchored protein YejM (alkaline phosphatase superfamily)